MSSQDSIYISPAISHFEKTRSFLPGRNYKKKTGNAMGEEQGQDDLEKERQNNQRFTCQQC